MVDDTTSDDNAVSNKGVNAYSNLQSVGVHKGTDTTSISTSTNPPSRSLTDIKNEIQTVLDLMGPSTPNMSSSTPDMSSQQNTSSDADNEESVQSIPSKQKQRKSPDSSERKSSQMNSETSKNVSVLADFGTLSSRTNNVENVDSFVECVAYDHTYDGFHPEPFVYRATNNCICGMKSANENSMPLQIVAPKTCQGNYSISGKKCTSKTTICKKKGLLDWLKSRSFNLALRNTSSNPCDLYKINISCQDGDDLPKRVVFDLVEGIPKPSSSTVATNTIKNPVEKFKTNSTVKCNDRVSKLTCECSKEVKNRKNETITREQCFDKTQKYVSCDSEGNTRVDYYYFDHGNAQYFNTTDTPPVMICEILAEKTEKYTTKFWAEFFASIHIGFSFCISFILQLFKFILYSIARPLTVGIMQLGSDYLFKPFLTTLFNGLIQPCLIFFYNVATSFRDLCDPIAEGFGYFLRELAVLCRAIRLCTYKKNTNDDCECNKMHSCSCDNKKYKCQC